MINKYIIIYKSEWGKIHTKEMSASSLTRVYSKFEKIKPTSAIQKVYLTISSKKVA